MQFLRSLFCLHGLDNRARYFAICSAAHIIFIILTSTFTGEIFLSFSLLILLSPVLVLTSIRRLKDANINQRWLLAPNLLFIAFSLIIIFSQQSINNYLLIISLISFSILLTYPSINKSMPTSQQHILGYYGPVDLSEYRQTSHHSTHKNNRIEPSFAGSTATNIQSRNASKDEETRFENYNESLFKDEHEQSIDMGEAIRLSWLNNKKLQLGTLLLLLIAIITISSSWTFSPSPKSDAPKTTPVVKKNSAIQNTLERNHPLSMPDNFSLFISQYQGITINWQADEVSTPLLWTQLSTKGDASCKEISFNKGKSIRTMKVIVESEASVVNNAYTNYFANFSPLDSKALIQAIAFRGSFSLCGYDFSLKGSQAALSHNKQYAKWIEY